MHTHARTASTVALAGLAGLIGLVACGDDSTSGPGVAAIDDADRTDGSDDVADDAGDGDDENDEDVDFEDALLEYTQCMRDEGVDMSQPVFVDGDGDGASVAVASADGEDGDAEITSDDIDALLNDEDYQAAQQKCGSLMDGAFGSFEVDPELQAEIQDQMLAWARCMRDRGHDVPDPQFHDDGTVVVEADVVGGTPGDDDGYGADSSACHAETGGGDVVGAVEIEGGGESRARPDAGDDTGAGDGSGAGTGAPAGDEG